MNESVVREGAGILYIIVAFLLGGGTAVVAVGMIANLVLKSPVLMLAIEKLASNVDPTLLASINAAAKLVTEATDNVPQASKPPLIDEIKPDPDFVQRMNG